MDLSLVAVPPGETIKELIEEEGILEAYLANKLGLSLDEIYDVLDGTNPITQQIADKLEEVLSPPSGFWMKLEEKYTSNIAKLNAERGGFVYPE